LERLKGRDHSEDLVIDGRGNIKMDLTEVSLEGVDWSTQLRIWTVGEVLCAR
jgi:hypothetical protein